MFFPGCGTAASGIYAYLYTGSHGSVFMSVFLFSQEIRFLIEVFLIYCIKYQNILHIVSGFIKRNIFNPHVNGFSYTVLASPCLDTMRTRIISHCGQYTVIIVLSQQFFQIMGTERNIQFRFQQLIRRFVRDVVFFWQPERRLQA